MTNNSNNKATGRAVGCGIHECHCSLQIPEIQLELLPLLPGLGAVLESLVDVPEVRMKRAVKVGDDKWTIDDTLVAAVWNPGNPLQTCFVTVEKYEGQDRKVDYYQIEYHEIPGYIKQFIHKCEGSGNTAVVTEVYNQQMKEWLQANSTLTHSTNIMEHLEQEIRYTPPVDD